MPGIEPELLPYQRSVMPLYDTGIKLNDVQSYRIFSAYRFCEFLGMKYHTHHLLKQYAQLCESLRADNFYLIQAVTPPYINRSVYLW